MGVALALFGLAPRWVGLAWGVWALWMVLAIFGSLLDPPALVLDLSPFEQTPLVPAQTATFLPLAVDPADRRGARRDRILGTQHRDIG